MAALPAPTNKLVDIVNTVLDVLLLGLGANAAITAATSAAPWLGLPIISWIFRQIVMAIADSLDTKLKASVDIIVIRFQNGVRKAEYDDAINQMKTAMDNPGVSDADKQKAIDAAKAAVRALVNRNK